MLIFIAIVIWFCTLILAMICAYSDIQLPIKFAFLVISIALLSITVAVGNLL